MKRVFAFALFSSVVASLSFSLLQAAPKKSTKRSKPSKIARKKMVKRAPKKPAEVARRTSGQTLSQGGLNPANSTAKPDLGVNASLRGWRPFPDDNPWNTPIDHLPVDANSDKYVASIGAGKHLHPDWGLEQKWGIPYVVVSGAQKRVPVKFEYSDESDHEPYPIPPDPPIEGGPDSNGDRHILMIDRDNWKLYELFSVRFKDNQWTAGSGAIFDLKSNALRLAGWTSADAAGLPIFPGLVRADEVFEQKEIRHALRFTVSRTRRAYVFPARHWASQSHDPNLPPMGMRVRLKANYDISKFSPSMQVILRALKKYGMIVADNGGDWFVSGVSDRRWNDDELNSLKTIKGRDFEVVKMENLVSG